MNSLRRLSASFTGGDRPDRPERGSRSPEMATSPPKGSALREMGRRLSVRPIDEQPTQHHSAGGVEHAYRAPKSDNMATSPTSGNAFNNSTPVQTAGSLSPIAGTTAAGTTGTTAPTTAQLTAAAQPTMLTNSQPQAGSQQIPTTTVTPAAPMAIGGAGAGGQNRRSGMASSPPTGTALREMGRRLSTHDHGAGGPPPAASSGSRYLRRLSQTIAPSADSHREGETGMSPPKEGGMFRRLSASFQRLGGSSNDGDHLGAPGSPPGGGSMLRRLSSSVVGERKPPVRTVALVGASGMLGEQMVRSLCASHVQGKLRLVILAREDSKVISVPEGVERRTFDLETATKEQVTMALGGINVLISTAKVSFEANKTFLENLATLTVPPILIPSWFTANWTSEEEDYNSNPYIYSKAALLSIARRWDISLAPIVCGLLEPIFFHDSNLSGVFTKQNRVELYGDALDHKMSVSSIEYIADGVAQLVVDEDFRGRTYTLSEVEFTGEELVAALTAVHGKPTMVKHLSDQDLEATRKLGYGEALGAGWKVHWGMGRWKDENRFAPQQVRMRTLEEMVRDAVSHEA